MCNLINTHRHTGEEGHDVCLCFKTSLAADVPMQEILYLQSMFVFVFP